MKFRCPHCKQILDKLERGLCPFCSKAFRLPEPPPRESYVPRARRAPSLQMQGGPIAFLTLFSQRPSFLIWVVGISVVAAVALSMFRVDAGTPRHVLTEEDRAREMLCRLHTALQWFRQTNHRYPTAEEGLGILANSRAPGWDGTYVNRVPRDPWGSPFEYSCSNDTVRLFSSGPDGIAGTTDDIASPGPDYKGVVERLSLRTTATN